jgi:hypothetical protein
VYHAGLFFCSHSSSTEWKAAPFVDVPTFFLREAGSSRVTGDDPEAFAFPRVNIIK